MRNLNKEGPHYEEGRGLFGNLSNIMWGDIRITGKHNSFCDSVYSPPPYFIVASMGPTKSYVESRPRHSMTWNFTWPAFILRLHGPGSWLSRQCLSASKRLILFNRFKITFNESDENDCVSSTLIYGLH